MAKGKINVESKNIFPIIKKFLYSDQEIFLREMISNAVDATQKIKTLARTGKLDEELGDTTIQVSFDEKAQTITISDRGVGMTAEEVDKYINQIALSSAQEFVEKYKDADSDTLIGQFGLGFYSAFMVAEKVELVTKSWKKDAQPVKWECDGSPEYSIEETEKEERGTDVILHIGENGKEFLDDSRLLELLKKYSKFVPVPVQFGTEKVQEEIEGEKDEEGNPKTKEVEKPRLINNTEPAWTKAPAELSDEDYQNFYRELYPTTFEEPLFHIHLNVDYPFKLTGILYFPKIKQNLEVQRNKIQLYSNQVFITDSVEDIVPEFLTLLHGVIDSPDIPLNVSRSYLQSDSNVRKISNHIMKKVSDKLEELFKNDREDFQKKWDDIKVFIEYGMLSEEKFFDRAKKYTLLKNTEGEYYTLDEYKEKIKDNQTDKDGNVIHLYATDQETQYTYIQSAKDRGYDVLILDGPIDSHFVNLLEQKLEKSSFKRVDADVTEKLIPQQDEEMPSKLTDEQKEKLKPLFEEHADSSKFNVKFETMSESEMPVIITQDEFMRRMMDMQKTGGMNFMGGMPESYNLTVNENHPIINEIVEENDSEKQSKIVKQITDLALLSQNLLKGEELTKFIKRSVDNIR
ncbi:MAG: molecular chaperone HtpG [Bacteroidales bacterium]|nr:molecular chaperone HtpG [Bacteroidales bacterium]MCF8328589.1 molecular chaperone HtpG [Bacteroidales bacterium]